MFPVVLFGRDYWQGMIQWLEDRVVGEGKVDAKDLELLHVTDHPAEAVGWVLKARELREQSRRRRR
jgi:predicted Rossmann-fold nucleotide-binding protein